MEVLPAAFGEYNSIDEWSGTDSMNVEYIKSTRSVCPDTSGNSKTKLLFTFTAMHGVGLKPVEAIMNEFEFSQKNLSIVPLQAQPDPLFPTVKFPNPEEKGALVC